LCKAGFGDLEDIGVVDSDELVVLNCACDRGELRWEKGIKGVGPCWHECLLKEKGESIVKEICGEQASRGSGLHVYS